MFQRGDGGDHPAFGDRRVNRRSGDDRRNGVGRRRVPTGVGRVGRRGPCRECGEETEHVVPWNGEPARLCVECAAKIRGGE